MVHPKSAKQWLIKLYTKSIQKDRKYRQKSRRGRFCEGGYHIYIYTRKLVWKVSESLFWDLKEIFGQYCTVMFISHGFRGSSDPELFQFLASLKATQSCLNLMPRLSLVCTFWTWVKTAFAVPVKAIDWGTVPKHSQEFCYFAAFFWFIADSAAVALDRSFSKTLSETELCHFAPPLP